MKQLSVTEWRSQLGELRQSSEVAIVLYHRRPTALMVPVPPSYWTDSTRFLAQLMSFRDRFLQPPHSEKIHDWVQDTYAPVQFTLEDARRGSAQLFGYVMRNTPVILTFYTQYEAVAMIPLPSGLSSDTLEQLYDQAQRFVLTVDALHVSSGLTGPSDALPGVERSLIDRETVSEVPVAGSG